MKIGSLIDMGEELSIEKGNSQGLKEYLSKSFSLPEKAIPASLPDEDQVVFWESFLESHDHRPQFGALKTVFTQFHFPVKAGISQSQDYKAALLKGKDPTLLASTSGLKLKNQDQVEMFMHQSPAGKIPVISVGNPVDFEAIIQALAYKNEPKAVPASMGAILIKGLTNWNRLNQLKKVWKLSGQSLPWPLYFKKEIAPNRELYQDKVIVLSKKPYSGVSHQTLEISQSEWLEHSFSIRLHHECAHYYTQRYLGGMHIHLQDEVLADYMGIVQTLGQFDLNWFLAFLGVEGASYRPRGRMENYLTPDINSTQNKEFLHHVLRAVGQNLWRYNQHLIQSKRGNEFTLQLLSIASSSLSQLASKNAHLHLQSTHQSLAENSVFTKQ